MQVTPVAPVQPVADRRQRRAFMSIKHTVHTVTDTHTGERWALPEAEAWALFDKLNKGGTFA